MFQKKKDLEIPERVATEKAPQGGGNIKSESTPAKCPGTSSNWEKGREGLSRGKKPCLRGE